MDRRKLFRPVNYDGPCKIDCLLACDVPEGAKLCTVPFPRHNWADVLICPYEECGLAFLVLQNQTREANISGH